MEGQTDIGGEGTVSNPEKLVERNPEKLLYATPHDIFLCSLLQKEEAKFSPCVNIKFQY